MPPTPRQTDPGPRGTGPVPREYGAVPLDGLVEIRIHGVGGSTPQALLNDPNPERVAGDATTGFYRTKDGLHRTTSGPRRAEDPEERHTEAYSWGGLTSGSGWRVLWLPLLPFMLANMAGWALRPARGGIPSPRMRWASRFVALGATLNVVLVLTLAALDVLAFQCGATECGQRSWTAPLRWFGGAGDPGVRLVVGAVIPVAVIALLGLISSSSRARYEATPAPSLAGDRPEDTPATGATALADGLSDPRFWAGHGHRRLSRYHLSAATVLVAGVLAWCGGRTAEALAGHVEAAWLLPVVLTLVGGVLAAVLVLLRAERPWHVPASWGLLVTSVAALALAAVFCVLQPEVGAQPPGHLPGMRAAFNLGWGVVLGSLLLLWLGLTFRAFRRSSRLGHPVFRWAAPLVFSGFGLVLANLVLLGTTLLLAQWATPAGVDIAWALTDSGATGGDPIPAGAVTLYPAMQFAVSLLSMGLIVLVVGTVLVAAGCWWWEGRPGPVGRASSALATDYAAEVAPRATRPRDRDAWYAKAAPEPDRALTPRARAWVRSVARWRLFGRSTHALSYPITIGVLVGLVLATIIGFWFVAAHRSPQTWATKIGLTLAVAVPPALLVLARGSWGSPGKRRTLGILWDVGTFFPRGYHPFAPPSYAERAVPELIRRLWLIHDFGGRVVITAHSQGSVIAVAALAGAPPRPQPSAEPRVGLVTFGSPVVKLYQWGFPAYFTPALVARLAAGTSGFGSQTWRNLYYLTDPIGGPVEHAHVDRELADPPMSVHLAGSRPPAPGSHTGYWRDPWLWSEVARLGAELRRPAVVSLPPGTPQDDVISLEAPSSAVRAPGGAPPSRHGSAPASSGAAPDEAAPYDAMSYDAMPSERA